MECFSALNGRAPSRKPIEIYLEALWDTVSRLPGILSKDLKADLKLDGSVIRAHQHAAGLKGETKLGQPSIEPVQEREGLGR